MHTCRRRDDATFRIIDVIVSIVFNNSYNRKRETNSLHLYIHKWSENVSNLSKLYAYVIHFLKNRKLKKKSKPKFMTNSTKWLFHWNIDELWSSQIENRIFRRHVKLCSVCSGCSLIPIVQRLNSIDCR